MFNFKQREVTMPQNREELSILRIHSYLHKIQMFPDTDRTLKQKNVLAQIEALPALENKENYAKIFQDGFGLDETIAQQVVGLGEATYQAIFDELNDLPPPVEQIIINARVLFHLRLEMFKKDDYSCKRGKPFLEKKLQLIEGASYIEMSEENPDRSQLALAFKTFMTSYWVSNNTQKNLMTMIVNGYMDGYQAGFVSPEQMTTILNATVQGINLINEDKAKNAVNIVMDQFMDHRSRSSHNNLVVCLLSSILFLAMGITLVAITVETNAGVLGIAAGVAGTITSGPTVVHNFFNKKPSASNDNIKRAEMTLCS